MKNFLYHYCLFLDSVGFGQKDSLEDENTVALKRPKFWICGTSPVITVSDDDIEQAEDIDLIRKSVNQINKDTNTELKSKYPIFSPHLISGFDYLSVLHHTVL